MVVISIGQSERSLEQFDLQWAHEQIEHRRGGGQPICVRVIIEHDGLTLGLATPGCASRGGSTRPLTLWEQDIIDLWRNNHLESPDFSAENLSAFLQHLKRVV